jgi:hypothetical protein
MDDIQLESASNKRRRKLIRSIRLPNVSGKASAAWLVVCFALTAALIPMAVRLPLWIDFEIVVGVWWLIWVVVLGRLFYLGKQISDDHQFHQPRSWFGSGVGRGGRASSSDYWWVGFGDTDGCAIVIGIIITLITLLAAVWLVVEVAVPLVAFLLYFLMRGMLAQALNVDHGCRGRLLASVSRGVMWATLYTAPLVGVVWVIHRYHA